MGIHPADDGFLLRVELIRKAPGLRAFRCKFAEYAAAFANALRDVVGLAVLKRRAYYFHA